MRASWAYEGMTVGQYTLVRPVGEPGGFGAVWLASSANGAAAAIKFLDPLPGNQSHALGRFSRELAAAQKVHSRNVAGVKDSDLGAEYPWIAYEYIDGDSLNGYLDGSTLDLWDAVTIFTGVARGMEALLRPMGDLQQLEKPITHRDLTLDNIMVTKRWDGNLDGVIVDLGIASLGTNSYYTQDSVGRVEHQAPEQWDSVKVTPAIDVWQFGVTLVRALSGRWPYPYPPKGGVGRQRALLEMRMSLDESPNLVGVPTEFVKLAAACLTGNPLERPTPWDLLSRLDEIRREITPLVHMRLVRVEVDLAGTGVLMLRGVVQSAGGDEGPAPIQARALLTGGILSGRVMIGDILTMEAINRTRSRLELHRRGLPEPGLRDGTERPFERPLLCPSCHQPLECFKSGFRGGEWRCSSPRWCPVPLRKRLGRVAGILRVTALDAAAVEALLSGGLLQDEGGLFSLTAAALKRLPEFTTSNATGSRKLNDAGLQLIGQIEAARTHPFENILRAVGLDHGFSTRRWSTPEDFLEARAAALKDPRILRRLPLLEVGQLFWMGSDFAPGTWDYTVYQWPCEVLREWVASGLKPRTGEPQEGTGSVSPTT